MVPAMTGQRPTTTGREFDDSPAGNQSTASAYVGLGSNLPWTGDRLATLRSVVGELDGAALPETRVRACSSVFESRALVPAGEPAQPDYLNAVVEIATALEPVELMLALLALEQRYGRVRGGHWAPRTLDLDLLLYVRAGATTSIEVDIWAPRLVLPHPRAAQRDFVLAPLAELAPAAMIAGTSVEALLAAIPDDARTLLRQLVHPLRP